MAAVQLVEVALLVVMCNRLGISWQANMYTVLIKEFNLCLQDYGMSPSEALAHHRLHDQIAPDETHLEIGRFDDELAAELEKMGHKIKWLPSKDYASRSSDEYSLSSRGGKRWMWRLLRS